MNKYIVILSIIIVLYFVQKYCIQSEVEKFLLTKNIIEKFGANDIPNLNGLNISGNIILGDKIIIKSDISGLKILDGDTGTPSNLSVNNIDISGLLIMRGGMNFTGNNNSFTNGGATLSIYSGENNSVGIRSENGPLILNGSDISNKIILGGNTDISGLFRINNVIPILTKEIVSAATVNPTTRNVNTGVNALTYPSITFSRYNNNSTSTTQYANVIEFNTYVETDGLWYVSLTPAITPEIRIRVTFFHKNLVQNDAYVLYPPTISTVVPSATGLVLTITAPTNVRQAVTTYTATAINTSSNASLQSNQIAVSGSVVTITGLSPSTNYSVTVRALNGIDTSTRTVTSLTTPATPTNLRSWWGGYGTGGMIAWDPPLRNGVADPTITGYKVNKWTIFNGTTYGIFGTVNYNGTTTSAAHGESSTTTTRWASIIAINSAGESIESGRVQLVQVEPPKYG